MANNKDKRRRGTVPRQALDQLNEYTAGGFVLFYFNSEDGTPEQVMTFDSPAHCLALQKHINDWSLAVQDLSVEGEKVNLIAACKPDEGCDEIA